MALDTGIWVEKKGKLLMANKYSARSFKSVELARNFVMNLIWVSKDLMPSDFTYLV